MARPKPSARWSSLRCVRPRAGTGAPRCVRCRWAESAPCARALRRSESPPRPPCIPCSPGPPACPQEWPHASPQAPPTPTIADTTKSASASVAHATVPSVPCTTSIPVIPARAPSLPTRRPALPWPAKQSLAASARLAQRLRPHCAPQPAQPRCSAQETARRWRGCSARWSPWSREWRVASRDSCLPLPSNYRRTRLDNAPGAQSRVSLLLSEPRLFTLEGKRNDLR